MEHVIESLTSAKPEYFNPGPPYEVRRAVVSFPGAGEIDI
jgi:hypothetical protein